MEVTIHPTEAYVIVAVSGELDVDTAPQLRAELSTVIGQNACDVLMDLTGVSFMDSTGLGTLVACLKHARSRGVDLCVRGASSAVRRVFEVTGLTDVFALESEPARSDPDHSTER